ncbi:MAG: membrane protein insertase YidC, partial [Pseudomonadota bacterium]
MDEQNRNLLLAMVLCTTVLMVWWTIFPPPEPTPPPDTEVTQADGSIALPGADAGTTNQTATAPTPADTNVAQAARIAIDTPSLDGSISLAGGRIDTLALKDYRVSLDPASEQEQLLSPVGTAHPYYTLFGWTPGGDLATEDVPGPDTLWSVESGETLTTESSVVLRWESPAGL